MSSQAEMGLRAFKEGRIAEAIVFLEYATKFNPENHPVWLALARAYQKDGQDQKAAEAYMFVLENTQDAQLAGHAQTGLGTISNEKVLATVNVATQRQLVCPQCGLEIPQTRAERPWCGCGWNNKNQAPPATKVYLADIQAYCRRKSVRVSIMFRGDVIVISATEVRIQGIGTKTYPVNARLLFNQQDNMLIVDRSDLSKVMAKVDDDALFRERNASDDITIGKLFGWTPFLARLSEFRGYDVSTHVQDTTLAGVLASYNALDADLIKDAKELKEPNETLGQTLLRLGIANFEAMVSAVVGDFRIAKPGARPFHERVGSMLVSKGVITPVQLQEALALQATLRKPIGEILATHLQACSLAEVQAVIKAQRTLAVMLPEADMLGEQLVARQRLTRTDMLQALADEQTKRRVPLGEVLLNMGLIKGMDLAEVLDWQNAKKQVVANGSVRLGEILMSQRAITDQQLAEALKAQAMDHRPLGAILLAQGACTPEQVLGALDTQIIRRNKMASSGGVAEPEPMDAPPAMSSPRRGAPTQPLKTPTGRVAGGTGSTRGKAPAPGRAPAGKLASGKAAPGRPAVKSAPSRSAPSPIVIIAAAVLAIALVGAGAFFLLKPGTPAPVSTSSSR